jgi:nicotinate-nucleotide--dimethylbenzimidazole phosphoribosyltransferase
MGAGGAAAVGAGVGALAGAGAVAVGTGSVTTASAGATVGGAGTVGALTALGTGAKVVLFVAAVAIGSAVTVGVRAAIPEPAPVRSVVKPTPPSAPRAVAPQPLVAPPEPLVAPEPVAPEPVAVEPQPVTPVSTAPKLTARRMPGAPPQITSEPDVVSGPDLVAAAPQNAPATPDLTPPPPAPNAPPTPQSATTEEGFELVVEAHFPSCDAATEMRTAQAARRLLVESRAEHALFLIGAYQKHCPSGQWSDEAWRVRLSSLCFLGRDTEAASLFEWFASEYPHRKFAIESELRSTCNASVLKGE